MFAAPQLLVASLIFEGGQWQAITNATWVGWSTIVYMGLIMTAGGYGLWYHLLGIYRVNQVMRERAHVKSNRRPGDLTREEAERLHHGIQATKIMAPPTDCIAPIGEDLIERALRAEVKADFYAAVTRRPMVYRGNPFLIEVGLAYGGDLPAEDTVTVFRYANRVPLQYQQGGCAITRLSPARTGRHTSSSSRRARSPSGPRSLWCTLRASRCRSPPRARKRSRTTPRSSRRCGSRCRSAGAASRCTSASAAVTPARRRSAPPSLTAYIFIGIHFEERDLVRAFGKQYAEYQQATSMIVPMPRRVDVGRLASR